MVDFPPGLSVGPGTDSYFRLRHRLVGVGSSDVDSYREKAKFQLKLRIPFQGGLSRTRTCSLGRCHMSGYGVDQELRLVRFADWGHYRLIQSLLA